MNVEKLPLFQIAAPARMGPIALAGERGALLVTTRGARVLGIFLDGVAENLLWVNPAVASSVESARRFVEAGEWNLGGDRCWLSPELELHFLDAENPSHESYTVPADIDPGNYELEKQFGSGVTFLAPGRVKNARSGGEFSFHMTRTISLCAPPIDVSNLSYVGYELASELIIVSPDRPEACYGLWQLLQLPAGGTLAIAVRGRPPLVDYFSTGAASHCRCTDACATFPITGRSKHKIGLTARDVTGRMGYYRPIGKDQASLIVRQANVLPGATYADYPAHERDRRDVAIQAYNDSGQFGAFGEMEYHVPAACAENDFHARDVSRTWCFAGSTTPVRDVMQELLGSAAE